MIIINGIRILFRMANSKLVQFTVRGQIHSLTREQVISGVKKAKPGLIQKHAVEIDGVFFPIKQAFGIVTKIDVLAFQTAEARRVFERLGFKVERMNS